MTVSEIAGLLVLVLIGAVGYYMKGLKAQNESLNNQVLDSNREARMKDENTKYEDAKNNADAAVSFYDKLKSEGTSNPSNNAAAPSTDPTNPKPNP